MSYTTVGIVDYGMGNHASVYHSLHSLGFRVRISKEFDELDAADVLVLPGVGSFPEAMRGLHERGLVDYLKAQVSKKRPVVGICLGMQLFATVSHEYNQNTAGLGVVDRKSVV